MLLSQRWILSYLFFWGYFFTYALRVNISVAIVCMVKTPIDNASQLNNLSSVNTSLNSQCGILESQNDDQNEVCI